MMTSSAVLSVIIILFSAYIAWRKTSQYLDHKDRSFFVRNLVVVGIVMLAVQLLEQRHFFAPSAIWLWAVCLLYMMIPAIFFKCNRYAANLELDVPYSVIDSKREIMSVLYLAVFCFSAQYECALGGGRTYFILSLVLLLVVLFPAVYIGYYLKYGECISAGSIMAIQQTNVQEAIEYLRTVLKKKGLVAISLVTIIFLGLCCLYFSSFAPEVLYENVFYVGALGIISGVAFCKALIKGKVLMLWKSVRDYRESERLYKVNHAKRYEKIKVSCEGSLSEKLPGTVILVIGESASREYMHVYDENFKYENTPWLDAKKNDEHFVILDNAYATVGFTMEVLKRSLTEASQYNDKDFNEAVSVIDIANKAGYRTHWFSHHGLLGQDNIPTTMVAATADVHEGPLNQKSAVYDKELLDLVRSVDGSENNFIVIHIMGSHAYYEARYPAEWRKWKEGTIESDYANTILYTDEFLEELFDYAKANLNLQCMMYFSDHGENMKEGHRYDLRTPDTLRIPMFIYLSESYREVYREKAEVLVRNKNRFYSNDMVYNTMVGLLNVRTDHYDGREDISSEEYAYDKDTVLTFLGQEHASDY